MSHCFAMTMSKPHEALGLPQPLGRRIPSGIAGWNLLLVMASIVCGLTYIVEVNAATTKGYRLREIEQRVSALKVETLSLQNAIAEQSSLDRLATKAATLGLGPVESVSFISPVGSSYALAR